MDVKEIGCDLLTISAHKFHGPQGTGALFVRKGTLLQPLFYGGRHERSRRAGTENLAGIVGLGKAAEIARNRASPMASVAKIATLRDRLENTILAEHRAGSRERRWCAARAEHHQHLTSTALKARRW